jgi:Do/DeqQ family serine protease
MNNIMEKLLNKSKWMGLLLAGSLGGLVSLGAFAVITKVSENKTIEAKQQNSAQMARYAGLNATPAFDFAGVAEVSTPAVVHIKTTIGSASAERKESKPMDPFDFFGNPGFRFESPMPRAASGSGVILSDDGYIVTNNHVVEGATKVEVVLNDKRTYVAEIIGTDKNTDLALLRIGESGLPFMKLGSSEGVKVGQWVVAVGNPFNLESTVTVGIVSAMGRNIDLIRSKGNKYAIENFIQTDAAINPGNSGGALVNTAGELIGINTAIASETGSYTGYAFAIPVDLVKKVVNDIMKYGKVQRGLLGVSIQDINQQLADDKGFPDLKGVYVAEIVDDGAAQKAGVKKGDVILKINDVEVNSSSRLQEEIGKSRPGDKVKVTLRRKSSTLDLFPVLLNESGKTSMEAEAKETTAGTMGIEFENATREERQALGLKNAVKVKSIGKGVFKDAGIPPGFYVTHINNEPVYSVQGAVATLKSLRGAITIEGKTSDGKEKIIAVKIPASADEEE